MPDVPGNIYSLNREFNPNARFEIGNAVAFADAAGTAPVDGTGGAPSVTIARTISSPLDGIASYLFTKDAANRQGQGWSKDYALQPDDATKILNLTFDYQITTGTYTGYQALPLFSDMTMWFYDVTNSIMYQMQGFQLDGTVSTTNQYSYQGSVQCPAGCLVGRVIVFLGNTGASAFTARFNNISFGREPRVQGTVSTNPAQWTPGITGLGTVTAPDMWWWRTGPVFNFQGRFTNGTVGASVLCWINLPSGIAMDTQGFTGGVRVIGWLGRSGARAYNSAVLLGQAGATSIALGSVIQGGTDAGANMLTQQVGGILSTGDVSTVYGSFQVLGWGANGTLGQDADTRVLACQYTIGTTTAFNSSVPINFGTKTFDNFGGVTTGLLAWRCYVPVAGYWKFEVTTAWQSINTAIIYKNGASNKQIIDMYATGVPISGGLLMEMSAGDYVDVRPNTGTTLLLTTDATKNYFSAYRLSGPAQVQANDVPKSSYSTNAGQSIANAATPIVDFEDKNYDTFGSVTIGAAWKFTASRAGVLDVDANIVYASAVFTFNTNVFLYVYKNGVLYKKLDEVLIQAAVSITDTLLLGGSCNVQVLAGDTVDIRTAHGEAAARSLTTVSTENYCDISYTDGM